eukprot:gene16056-biopygen12779
MLILLAAPHWAFGRASWAPLSSGLGCEDAWHAGVDIALPPLRRSLAAPRHVQGEGVRGGALARDCPPACAAVRRAQRVTVGDMYQLERYALRERSTGLAPQRAPQSSFNGSRRLCRRRTVLVGSSGASRVSL